MTAHPSPAERLESSLQTIVRKDQDRVAATARAEAENDDAEIALEALRVKQVEAMDACRAAINALAEYAGSRESDRRRGLEVVEQELGEVVWERRMELEREIERCGEVIERAERL